MTSANPLTADAVICYPSEVKNTEVNVSLGAWLSPTLSEHVTVSALDKLQRMYNAKLDIIRRETDEGISILLTILSVRQESTIVAAQTLQRRLREALGVQALCQKINPSKIRQTLHGV